MVTVKVKDGFSVPKFMELLKLDFVYAKIDGRHLLLNNEMFGDIAEDVITAQKANFRVAIIEDDTMSMEVYNIPEEEVLTALLEMG